MKLKYLFLLVCLAALLNSCKKSDSSPVEDYTGLSYTVNGMPVTKPTCSARWEKSTTTNILHLVVSFFYNGGDLVELAFPDSPTGPGASGSASAYLVTYSGLFMAQSTTNVPMKLSITSLTSKKVIGNFQFEIDHVGVNSFNRVFTDGKFGCIITNTK